jgi:hypothetical protein
MAEDGFIERFVDRLIEELRNAVFGNSGDGVTEAYAEAAAGRFIAPQQTSPTIEPMLQINDFMTTIAMSLLGFYIIWLIAKFGFGMLRGSNAVYTGARLLIGVGLIAINVDLVFGLFELSSQLVDALFYFRAQEMASQGIFGETALSTFKLTTETFMTGGLALLLHLVSNGMLIVALYLRWVFLHMVVALAPVIIASWIFGNAIGVGSIGLGASVRAIFFTIPLAMGLLLIEIINPQIAYGFFHQTITAMLVLGVIWVSLKLSAVGRLATGGTKAAAGALALGGTAYVLGGSGMVKKAGISKSFGVGGIPLARAVGEDGQQGSGGGGGQQTDPRKHTATRYNGQAPPDREVVDESGRSEEGIRRNAQKNGVTPTTEKYADNSRWYSERNLLEQMEATQTGKGTYRSVHEEGGAPDDLTQEQQEKRTAGNMKAMEEDHFRTEEEYEDYWSDESSGVEKSRESASFPRN